MFFMDRHSYKFLASLGIALLVSSGRVSACEGNCIVSITNALTGNYTVPMNLAMSKIGDAIVAQLIPNNNVPSISYLRPIIEEYNRRSYDNMENAIFKSFFHGKCQNPVTGIDPPGCPNPDCPVVCGTPGSMVHFYSQFRYRAFNATIFLINKIADSSSPAYQQVENLVVSAASSNTARRRHFRFKRFDDGEVGQLESAINLGVPMERRDNHVEKTLRSILRQFREILTKICGGTDGKADGLPICSWEQAFKEYILTFP